MSTDPAVSRAFYAALFGWGVDDGDRPRFRLPSRGVGPSAPIGAILPLDPDLGWPSHWLSYVAAPDVDRAAARVLSAGGEVLHPPTEIPGVGRFVVCADPLGALFGALSIDAAGSPGAVGPVERDARGSIGWNELLTGDDGVRGFYEAVFGYTSLPGHGWVLLSEGEARAGVRRSSRVVPPAWVPYVGVDDVEAAVERAVELGATVLERPVRVPDLGRFALLADPLGAVVGVWR